MNADTFIKAQLAEMAICEGARHGGANNMAMVAFVMKNRVDAGWYGGEWMDVLANAWERAGTVYKDSTSGCKVNLRNSDVRAFLQRIDDIYDGSEEDTITDGALFYCELNQVDREWFKQNVLRDREAHRMVGSVGPVAMFR